MQMIGLARLGRDAELRILPSGEAVANLSLAVNYGKKGDDGNRPTQWIEASFWGRQAEATEQFLLKGTVHCFTLSDIHIETFQRRDGGEGTKMVARVDRVELGPRVEGQQRQAAPAPAPRPAPAPAPRPAAPAPAPAPSSSGFDDTGDDIPF